MSWVLVEPQMPLMLLPAPRNRAADASATNAINSVYSIKSWPCSSVVKCLMIIFMFVFSWNSLLWFMVFVISRPRLMPISWLRSWRW